MFLKVGIWGSFINWNPFLSISVIQSLTIQPDGVSSPIYYDDGSCQEYLSPGIIDEDQQLLQANSKYFNNVDNYSLIKMESKIPYDLSNDFEIVYGKDDTLRESTRQIHGNSERFYCPECNVKYTKFKYLKSHLKVCGESFECPYCNNVYKQKRTFVVHVKTKHNITEEYLET